MKKTIQLLRPYRGWISGRELWQAGKYALPEDAANHLIRAGYATYEPPRRGRQPKEKNREAQ